MAVGELKKGRSVGCGPDQFDKGQDCQTRYEQRAEKLAVGRLAINRGQECWQLADST